MQAAYAATIAGCPGRWVFAVGDRQGRPDGAAGDPFRTPEPGRFPPIILGRAFVPDPDAVSTPECEALFPDRGCIDYWVVVIERN